MLMGILSASLSTSSKKHCSFAIVFIDGNDMKFNNFLNDFEVQHTFESLGPRTMLLNARTIDGLKMILLAIEDITKRKEAEEKVRRSEESYHSLADLSSEAILVTIEENLRYANPAAVRLLGAETADGIIGRPLFDFVAPEDHGSVRDRIARLKQQKVDNGLLEQRWRRIDGADIDAEMSASAISWGGEPAVQMLLRDISARKSAAAERGTAVDRGRTKSPGTGGGHRVHCRWGGDL
ncbi:MAG: PAS domain S-box protein [Desulfuromonadales bacterium]|nr:PAS domain S-box protein [Desulfuromonadales bacterium]